MTSSFNLLLVSLHVAYNTYNTLKNIQYFCTSKRYPDRTSVRFYTDATEGSCIWHMPIILHEKESATSIAIQWTFDKYYLTLTKIY